MRSASIDLARRNLLRFLAASPVISASVLSDAIAQDWTHTRYPNPIPPLDQALNVFDFEAVAKQRLSRAHWAYLATGVDDEATLQANRDGFARYDLRVRRMIDVGSVDMSLNLFGQQLDSPILLAPVSSLDAFYPDGELYAARAAKAGNHLQMVSTLSSSSYESVNEARGGGVWFQLYATDRWDITVALLKRVREAGAPVLVVTVDLNGGSNRETYIRAAQGRDRDCRLCHQTAPMDIARLRHKAMFSGLDVSTIASVQPSMMTWETLKALRDHWPGKLILKGIVTQEDAELCVRHGVDAIYVSNHGGRAEESGRPIIESLREVVAGANGKAPIIVDGGVRRGTDIYKALAMGATAVSVGRPYVWGLTGYGQAGCEAVLRILRRELATAMRQAGVRNLAEISSSSIVKA